MNALPVRYQPFGIDPRHLAGELSRRRRAHQRTVAPRRLRLQQLQAMAGQCRQYVALLRDTAALLEAEEESLLQQLATVPQDEPPAEQAAALQASLIHYRTVQQQISQGVLALIRPFLAEQQHAAKGGDTWPQNRGSTGSDAR